MTGQAGQTGESPGTAGPSTQRNTPPEAPAPGARPPASPPAPPLPTADSGPPETIWLEYFSQHRPRPAAVVARVDELLAAKRHDHIVALIEAALIHEQSQPWMYEALAASMEAIGRPREEIERVVLSLADFGTTDFSSLTFSAAYLVRLGRDAAGLRLYREASRLLPEQPEPYVLGLRLARKLKDVDAIEWAAAGVLQFAWSRNYQQLHREAERAAAETVQSLERMGDAERAQRLRSTIAQARRRDLAIRLVWSGEGDLDLLVEEPPRTVCSFQNRETPAGGFLVHDGQGPAVENCYEEYVCPLALPGEYRVTIRHVWGTIVGGRATLTVTRAQGSPQEQVSTQTVLLGAEEPVVRLHLDAGRRVGLRSVAPPEAEEPASTSPAPPAGVSRGKVRQAAAQFAESRQTLERTQIRPTGAVGFQPIIQTIPDGATFSARAVVSPDRRYVRIGVNPLFTNITDVFTFTFFSGPLGFLQPGLGGQGN